MENILAHLLERIDFEPVGWDDEFYVGIGKASELSRLSESQIRYFEKSLQGIINIGKREGPHGRNRVYTKRDIRLLKWVYKCDDVRPAEMSHLIKENQKAILERLGQLTLSQAIQHEQSIAGRDALISGLASVLLSIWQETVTPTEARIRGAILGPQNATWKEQLLQNIESSAAIDLKDCLVMQFTSSEIEGPADHTIFFSHQSWYLPFSEEFIYDTNWLDDTNSPFAVVLLWQCPANEKSGEQEQPFAIDPDEPKKLLIHMLMKSLKHSLEQRFMTSDEAVTVFSRAVIGPTAIVHGFSLLLKHCIQPYFPDCYTYIARFGKDDQLEFLGDCGESSAGYTSQLLDSTQTLDAHRFPWWVTFAKEQAGMALDQDSRRRPESREERGSVVCIPLMGQDKVLGVLGIENIQSDPDVHCLAPRQGSDGPGLLRYLTCIAEIAAEYLNHFISSFERAERSRLAFTRYETPIWHWNVYQQGGLNYARVVEKILEWIQQIGLGPKEEVDIAIIDVIEDRILAKEYKGYDIVIDLVQKTHSRIHALVQNDPVAADLASKKHLVLFDEPITDHLVLATVGVEMGYLLVFLERTRRIWQAANDVFTWEGQKVPISLQIGICKVPGLATYERGAAAELMKHHFWEISRKMIEGPPLERILEYDAVVLTQKVRD